MLIVIDAGNTRTKWAQVQADGSLTKMHAVTNATIATSALKKALEQADKVMIANVAGETFGQQLVEMVPENTEMIFVKAQAEACSVVNRYEKKEDLGVDRWAAVVAAWHMNKQPSIVINAGTAITVDALSRDKATRTGTYMGGIILPGLQLMYKSLADNAVQLPSSLKGECTDFPKNTHDAITSGCINAVVGAVVLQLKRLEKHSAFLPKVVISGGDAVKIAEALNPQLKRVIIAENLVLQGLALLEKENV
ncbi:MAG: type III pantothenate kinase [Methylophilaceae bacterium]